MFVYLVQKYTRRGHEKGIAYRIRGGDFQINKLNFLTFPFWDMYLSFLRKKITVGRAIKMVVVKIDQ